MRHFNIALCFLLFAALSGFSRAEITSLRVVKGQQRFSIPAFEHGGVLYASLNELSKGVGFATYENSDAGKIEVRIGGHRLKCTANNPFIVVLSQRENTISEVCQLPMEIMRTQVAYYLPLASALPLLSRIWKQSLLLDQTKAELVVTNTSKPVARVTGTPESAGKLPAVRSSGTETVAVLSTGKTGSKDAGTSSTGKGSFAPREIVVEKASAFDIKRVSVDTRKNGTLVRIHMRKAPKEYSSEMAAGRLVVTLTGATVDVNELRQTPTDGEGIIGVEAEQLGRNVRITFRLNDKFTSDKISRDVTTGDLLISLFKKAEAGKILRDEKKAKQDGDRSKWKLDCIVIDAGHGGRDPGAIGVTGIKEKNIALGIALKLGKKIKREMPGIKVVYTRKDDSFIKLDKRGQIANAAEGKLFISIHCNATAAKPSSAKGFEVYILRPGRTADAIQIAEFENSVIKLEGDYEKRYAKLDNESFILINMAQSAYSKYSERFADLLHQEVKGSAKISSRGVKQAGFYVLVGASMPGVLIESGFISNKKEEKYLSTNAGQEHMAQLFFGAISDYAKEYEKSLKD